MHIWLKVNLVASLMLSSAPFYAQSDVIGINVKGTVVNAGTSAPVEATIKYESLPFGSRVGFFSGSTFEFRLSGNGRFMLDVSAEGFFPYQEIIETSGESRELILMIKLERSTVDNFISLDKLTFGVGKATLTDESMRHLDRLVVMFNNNNNILIHLEGHSDFRGNARKNMKLSKRRVKAVKEYLIANGVDENRIKTAAFGGSQPLSKGNNADMKEGNRRVEVKIYHYNN